MARTGVAGILVLLLLLQLTPVEELEAIPQHISIFQKQWCRSNSDGCLDYVFES